LDVLPVWGHRKNGHWVYTHSHLSVGYLFEADEDTPIRIKPDENAGVMWADAASAVDLCSKKEPEMRYLYEKLMARVAQAK
jgi:hypothetical protein